MTNEDNSLSHIGSVELHNAYMWDCPHCGSENFQRAISFRPTAEDALEYGVDLSDSDECFLMTTPNYVSCRECKQRFKAASALQGGDDEEE